MTEISPAEKIPTTGQVNSSQVDQNILQEAEAIIYGDREKTYGKPSKNLACIATFWSAYLENRFGPALDLAASDVAVMMTLLKVARLANSPGHRDSLTDGAAYLALVERCLSE